MARVASLRTQCPHLRLQPLIRWASHASIEVAEHQGHHTLIGLEAETPSRLLPGAAIDIQDSVVRLHDNSNGNAGQYTFERMNHFWYLREQQPEPRLRITVGGVRVLRTPLLHGDRLVLPNGLVLRFRLDD